MLETQVNLKSTFGARKQGPIGTLSDANVYVRNNGKKEVPSSLHRRHVVLAA